MGRPALALAMIAVLAPCIVPAATHGRAAHRKARAAAARPRPARPTLAEAKTALKSLMRDRTRRRYHHNWERAIRGLLAAAKGKDAPAAYLEAARARYALYRWSANEADREKALINAGRAARLGAREASALARAIRREAGEDRPAPTRRRRANPPRVEPVEDEPAPDPELEAALADLSAAEAPRALPLGASDGAGRARVSEIKTWSSGDYTRVAVYLSHWVGWHKLELPAASATPRRLALDFRPAALAGAALTRPVEGVQIDRVRAAQNDPDTVRVVLDLPGEDGVELFALDDPPRLVVDVGTHEGRPPAVATATPTPAAAPMAPATEAVAGEAVHPERSADADASARSRRAPTATSPTVASPLPTPAPTVATLEGGRGRDELAEDPPGTVRRVVIDAGHGGHDPGAIGPRRVREKDVTLAIARRLAKKLRSAGFQVVLTRTSDRYLALEERTAIANTAKGDLFVSIHANAHPRRNRSGVETYFLNVADDRYAARLAARENGLDLDGETEVTRILSDLDAKASASASRRLAALVQREVTAGVRARVGEVRDLGVKSALFYVLLGARMPAVLVETAFISNRAEERRLASARYQDEVAAGIARAVSGFARSGARVAAR